MPVVRRSLVSLLLLSLCLLTFDAAGALPATQKLILLHTNDTHDHLSPYDKRDLKSVGGIARRATLIRKDLEQNPGKVLVLDAGDVFQGTPLYNFFRGEADYAAMDAAGYDALTVGNHDLDDGLSNLQRQAKGRKFKLINTNLVDPDTGSPLFMPFWLTQRAGLRIGILGLLGEGSAWAAIASVHRKGIRMTDRIAAARKGIEELNSKGVDFIVLLSHSGFEEDKELARKVAGIHVIIGGHSHTKVDIPVNVKNGDWSTLVAQAFQWGEYLGRIELEVSGKRIVSSNGYLIPIAGDTPEDAAVANIVASYEVQIRDKMRVVVGQSPHGLSLEAKYEGDCELGKWATDLLRVRTGAQIAILNSGGLRAPINPGPVKLGDVYSVFPFENRVVKLELEGEILRGILDQVAAKQVSMLQVSGLSLRLANGKATDVRVGGVPLDPQKNYTIATIDYIAQGNDKYALFLKAKKYEDSGALLREFILESLKTNSRLEAPDDTRIVAENR